MSNKNKMPKSENHKNVITYNFVLARFLFFYINFLFFYIKSRKVSIENFSLLSFKTLVGNKQKPTSLSLEVESGKIYALLGANALTNMSHIQYQPVGNNFEYF